MFGSRVVSAKRCRAILVISLALASLASAQESPLIDTTQGEINGKIAVSFWPIDGFEGQKLLGPSGFSVHMVPGDDFDAQELVFPCGRWFQPPPQKYKFWLEGNGMISASSGSMIYSGNPFRGRGLASTIPVVPAGSVRLAKSIATPKNGSIRFLHIESHNRDLFPRRELSRRIVGPAPFSKSVLMPAGQIVAGVFDNDLNEYVSLSRPTTVVAGEERVIEVRAPVGGTDLVLLLERPEELDSYLKYDVKVTLDGGEGVGAIGPDVVIPTSDRLYAIWYDLSLRVATIRVESPTVFLAPKEISFGPGKVERFHESLRSRPGLKVTLDLPEEIQGESLEVRDYATREVLESLDLTSEDKKVTTFLDLPPAVLTAELKAGPWLFSERIDLSSGDDGELLIRPEPIYVDGTVYRGDSSHVAEVVFKTNSSDTLDEVRATTNEDGEYETVLFEPRHYLVFVTLEGSSGAPHVEFLRSAITESTTIDFRVPAHELSVSVIDEATGRSIAGADVIIANTSKAGDSSSQGTQTDEEGTAESQPLKEGEVTVTAKAENYYPSEPLELQVEGTESSQQVSVFLTPVGEVRRVRLLSGAGAAVAGGEIAVLATDTASVLWLGTADQEGVVKMPAGEGAAIIAVRHPAFGSSIHTISKRSKQDEIATLVLPQRAEMLRIHVTRPWGDPVRAARLALWIGEHRVEDWLLGWLTYSHSGVNTEGFWQGNNLPPKATQLLAWTPEDDGYVATSAPGGALATRVPYPWPSLVELTTIH